MTTITPIKFLTCPSGVKIPDDVKVTDFVDKLVTVAGRVEWCSQTKGGTFVKLYDSWQTHVFPLQLVFDKKTDRTPFDEQTLKTIQEIKMGWYLQVTGVFVASPKAGQPYELHVKKLEEFGDVHDYGRYILAGDHTLHGLRDFPEDQCCSVVKSTIFGISSELTKMTHQFFDEYDFSYVYTPLISFSSCEGGCEELSCTQLLKDGLIWRLPKTEKGDVDMRYDFFGQPSFLTSSSQMELRTYLPMGPVWTMTTAVRGEASKTRKHLCEFRMLEIEMPSRTEEDIMEVAEKYLTYCIRGVLAKFKPYLEFLSKQSQFGLDPDRVKTLEGYVSRPFERIKHAEAITLLRKHHLEVQPFRDEPRYEKDLSSEHEKWLCEHFKHPVFVMWYPEDVKAFYMPYVQETEEESHGIKHVRSYDILIEGIEICGGSQRIHDYDELMTKIKSRGMDEEPLKFFTELARKGTLKHGGFGMGFERILQILLSVSIHDTVGFPRAYDGRSLKIEETKTE